VIRGEVRPEQKKLTADDEDSAEIGWSRLSNGELLRVEWVARRQCDIANGKLGGILRGVENDSFAGRHSGICRDEFRRG
jgi:hypothetical protein